MTRTVLSHEVSDDGFVASLGNAKAFETSTCGTVGTLGIITGGDPENVTDLRGTAPYALPDGAVTSGFKPIVAAGWAPAMDGGAIQLGGIGTVNAGVSQDVPLSHAASASRKRAVKELGSTEAVVAMDDDITCLSLRVDTENEANKRRRVNLISREMPTENEVQCTEVLVVQCENREILVYGGDNFLASPVIRKLLVPYVCEDQSVKMMSLNLHRESKILEAIRVASRIPSIHSCLEFKNWLHAWDYLLVPPPLETIYSIAQRILTGRTTFEPGPLRNRMLQVGNRGFLDLATGEIPGGTAVGSIQGALRDQIANHDGYALPQLSSMLEENTADQNEDELRLEEEHRSSIDSMLSIVMAIRQTLATMQINQKPIILHCSAQFLLLRAAFHCAKSVHGAKMCLQNPRLCCPDSPLCLVRDTLLKPSFVCGDEEELISDSSYDLRHVLSVLYSAECKGRPDCVLDLATTYAYRSVVPQRISQLCDYLPIMEDYHDVKKDWKKPILPIPDALPTRTPPQTVTDLMDDLRRRAPWVPNVLIPNRLWITGSLLSEVLEGQEAPAVASDVDLFCRAEDLDEFVDRVSTAMSAYAVAMSGEASTPPRLTCRKVSDYKWRIEIIQSEESMKCLPASPAALSCDLYVNSVSRVRRYHLPIVRAAFDSVTASIYPSCAVALATRINLEYDYVGGSKCPFAIIMKVWTRKFSLFVSYREQRQFAEYAAFVMGKEEWHSKARGCVDYLYRRSAFFSP